MEAKFPRHSMWRRAWIEDDSIMVDCVPEELEQYHLRDLKQDIANSNTKFRAYLEQEERRAKAAHDATQRERYRIEQLKKRLDFE